MPDVSTSAAPGVAFSYDYSFVLPDRQISSVQERHAAACEKLGATRCRIVGMRYALLDDHRIEGYLSFKLAPDIARQFGKDGSRDVSAADGKLVDLEISGEDVGSTLTSAGGQKSRIDSEIARIEKALADGKTPKQELAGLRERVEQLRRERLEVMQSQDEAVATLSNTPVTFHYEGDAGFSFGSNPIARGLDAAWASVTTILTVVLVGLGYSIPWFALAALILAAWRTRPVRWLRQWVQGRG
ncbi:DUF4349 domain-containing protein [Novosphingobium colocasiae]|uniref:DUF4349 domain-containing protein n=1 Tax=Novosphingobium colocasiae TaxID=1256513 RepID=UPI0035B0A0EB